MTRSKGSIRVCDFRTKTYPPRYEVLNAPPLLHTIKAKSSTQFRATGLDVADGKTAHFFIIPFVGVYIIHIYILSYIMQHTQTCEVLALFRGREKINSPEPCNSRYFVFVTKETVHYNMARVYMQHRNINVLYGRVLWGRGGGVERKTSETTMKILKRMCAATMIDRNEAQIGVLSINAIVIGRKYRLKTTRRSIKDHTRDYLRRKKNKMC